MNVLTTLPLAAASFVLWTLGVPLLFRELAPMASTALLAGLGALIFALTRGYRRRIVDALDPAHLVWYLMAFVVLDHAVNLLCFFQIELPILGPHMTVSASWLMPLLGSITVAQLEQIALNAAVLAVGLWIIRAPHAGSLALKIAVYSLPISLLIALPGADSWKAAMVAQIVVQAFTLWRLGVEGVLSRPAPQSAEVAVTLPPELDL